MDQETLDRGLQAVEEILEQHGLASRDVNVLRDTNNLVVHLPGPALIAKIAISRFAIAPALELAVGLHLQKENIPAARPSKALRVKVHESHGCSLTFWDYFPGSVQEHPDRKKSIALLEQLHRALDSFPAENLPRLDAKLDRCRELLLGESEMPGLASTDRSFLADAFNALKARLALHPSETRILHGDCRPYNLLWTQNCVAAWIDFEAVCVGPTAWDYLSFFGPEDESLRSQPGLTKILSDITHACVATWCWRKKDRNPQDQEAAEFHLEELKRKYHAH